MKIETTNPARICAILEKQKQNLSITAEQIKIVLDSHLLPSDIGLAYKYGNIENPKIEELLLDYMNKETNPNILETAVDRDELREAISIEEYEQILGKNLSGVNTILCAKQSLSPHKNTKRDNWRANILFEKAETNDFVAIQLARRIETADSLDFTTLGRSFKHKNEIIRNAAYKNYGKCVDARMSYQMWIDDMESFKSADINFMLDSGFVNDLSSKQIMNALRKTADKGDRVNLCASIIDNGTEKGLMGVLDFLNKKEKEKPVLFICNRRISKKFNETFVKDANIEVDNKNYPLFSKIMALGAKVNEMSIRNTLTHENGKSKTTQLGKLPT